MLKMFTIDLKLDTLLKFLLITCQKWYLCNTFQMIGRKYSFPDDYKVIIAGIGFVLIFQHLMSSTHQCGHQQDT